MTKNNHKYLFLSWDMIDKDISELAVLLKPELEKREINRICCISRGGLVPAALIARELDMHLLDTICIQSYSNTTQNENAEILKIPSGNGEHTLIIDDLTDSGKTADLVHARMPKAYIATVYAKPAGKNSSDLFLKEVSQDTWIIFPWEKYEGIEYP